MKKIFSLLLAFGICLFPSYAWANARVPMIFITLPLMLVGLVPIIYIEALGLEKNLNLNFKESLTSSFIANLISALIGIPLI